MRKVKEINSKLSAIRNSYGDTKNSAEDIYDRYLQDVSEFGQTYGKKLDEFLDKRKKKRENKKDIFEELLSIVENFISVDDRYTTNDKYRIKQKIKRYTKESISVTLEASKEIIQENVKKIFFAGEGICGANSRIPNDTLTIKPSEIDFLDVLTIDLTSNMGLLVYEPEIPNIGKQKVNRELYKSFTQGTYTFTTQNQNTLFTSSWNSVNQVFQISGLKQNAVVEVNDFFNDYFSSIELPDITGITKTAMLLTLQGDKTVSLKFKNGINILERLLKKLFAIAGSPTDKKNIKNQNASKLFDENEEFIDDYFDFDIIDDVDFETEDAIIRNVIKFIDCNNFEIPTNTDIIEDFSFLTKKRNIDDLVDETLEKAANDAHEQSDGSIPSENFNISLINDFIKNLPKALVLNVLSPKLFLPIVIIYKSFKATVNQVIETKELMKKLSKLFYNIIKDLFWKFITEFWKRIKVELLNFVRFLVIQILKSKYKRYINILTAIFEILKSSNINSLNNTKNLFDEISKTIEKSLSVKGSLNVPGLLLANSDLLPGMSKQKILVDAVEFLESKNISTADIYGQKNNIVTIMESVIDSLIQNLDKVSYVKASNKTTILPSPSGPVVIPQGLLTVTGKLF